MKFYVYILYSVFNDRYYIGQTNDVDARIIRHNNGYVKSTKPYRPWEIVHVEQYVDRASSMARENQLKSWKSKAKIIELVNRKSEMVELSSSHRLSQ
jgi:putative endonuclease